MLFSLLPSRIQSSPLYRYTGCFRVNDIMFLLISQAIKHLNKLDRSYISTESIAFWCIFSKKKSHNHSVVIHLWRLWRCIIGELWKIHWKSRIKRYQYCFAHCSGTKAWILMKFYVGVNYYLVNLSFIFHEDSCINALTRVVNTRVHVLSRVCAFTTHAHALMHGVSWNLTLKFTR